MGLELAQLLREVVELLRHAEFTSPTHAGAAIDRAAKLDAYRAELERAEPVAWVSTDLIVGNCVGSMAYRKRHHEQNVPLYRHPPTSAVPEWRPIDTAPKDRPILGLCRHDADPYFLEGGRRLTAYGAHVEVMSRVEDGPHVLVWGGELDCDDGYIPEWWFLNDGNFETAANPVAWMPIPAIDAARGGE